MSQADAQVLHDLLTRRGEFGHREHLELAWTYLGSHPVDEAERTTTAALAPNPGLLDRRLLAGHYSDQVLWSAAARTGWLEPDLRALPATA